MLSRLRGEELSLSIKIVRKLVEIVDPYTGDKLTSFLCTPLTSKIEISSELTEAKWFNLNEIQKLRKIHPGLKQSLIDGLKSNFFSGTN